MCRPRGGCLRLHRHRALRPQPGPNAQDDGCMWIGVTWGLLPAIVPDGGLFYSQFHMYSYQTIRKLERVSLNKCLTKLTLKCPLHLKKLGETWSVRLSRQRNNEVNIWMINWIATNITDSYCLVSLKKSHVRVTSPHLYYSVCSKCLPLVRTQAHKRWCH